MVVTSSTINVRIRWFCDVFVSVSMRKYVVDDLVVGSRPVRLRNVFICKHWLCIKSFDEQKFGPANKFISGFVHIVL